MQGSHAGVGVSFFRMNAPGTTRNNTAEEPIRIGGAVLGILVFLGGIALLVLVFTTARTLFGEAPPPPPVTPPVTGAAASADTPSAIPALGQSLMDFAKRLLLLLLMCIAGSVIASRGIELFFKACAAAPPRSGRSGGTSGGPTAGNAPAVTPVSSTP